MKNLFPIILVLIYAFTAFAGRSLVLCDTGNGHTKIEAAHENETHCSDHEHAQKNDRDQHSFHNAECGPCEDTALVIPQTSRIESLSFKVFDQISFESIHSVVDHGSIPCFEQSIYSKPPPRLNSSLTFLRTVILII